MRQLSIHSPTENQDLSTSFFKQLLSQHAEHNESSHEISKSTHEPTLLKVDTSKPITTVFYGHDFLSEFTNNDSTCNHTEPWPSEQLMPTKQFRTFAQRHPFFKSQSPFFTERIQAVLDLGVHHSESTRNIIYRLRGDSSKHLQPQFTLLGYHDIKLFVLSCGRYELERDSELSRSTLDNIRLIIQTLLFAGRAITKILLLGFLDASQPPNRSIAAANADLEGMVDSINTNLCAKRIEFYVPRLAVSSYGSAREKGKADLGELLERMASMLHEVDLLREAKVEICRNAEGEFMNSLKGQEKV